ncbi:MAG: SipW-dependent-type signal peptide-containing protein [Lachnospiraceae bacterium]|nr:SipW-dependent-type signal peptide-containing protein [Lachnospiraceae bacterium]
MKKRILLLALVVSACTFAGYGTLAYFTASEKTENIITAGNVKIDLCEETADGKPFPEKGVKNVMPGQIVDKIVYVKNVGDNTAWVRVKPKKDWKLADGTKVSADNADEYMELDFDYDAWTEKDGWFYYKEPVAPGTQTKDLFTTVTFSTTMGNEYKKSTAHIYVDAQAVQVDNNGAAVLDAAGWPAE